MFTLYHVRTREHQHSLFKCKSGQIYVQRDTMRFMIDYYRLSSLASFNVDFIVLCCYNRNLFNRKRIFCVEKMCLKWKSPLYENRENCYSLKSNVACKPNSLMCVHNVKLYLNLGKISMSVV